MTDPMKYLKTDQDIINKCMFPFLLHFCMYKVGKENKGHTIGVEWVKIVGQEFSAPIVELPGLRQTKIKKRVYAVADKCIKSSDANDFKEICLSVSIGMVDLIKDGSLEMYNPQTVEMASKIIEEQLEYGDWGNLKKAKESSKKITDELRRNNCFRGIILDGIST